MPKLGERVYGHMLLKRIQFKYKREFQEGGSQDGRLPPPKKKEKIEKALLDVIEFKLKKVLLKIFIFCYGFKSV